ncbi:MAG: aminoglycoside 3'-phosphotransferase, partial [Chitinophagaceae bacterium]
MKRIAQIVRKYFGEAQIIKLNRGNTAANVYKLITADEHIYLLKNQKDSLHSYYKNLLWLKGKIAVPIVHFYEQYQNEYYLCTAFIDGITLEDLLPFWKPEKVITIYASILKQLHAIPINDMAIVADLETKMVNAKQRMIENTIDLKGLQPEYMGMDVADLFLQLQILKPTNFDIVFTHGDYCFDNIIIQNNDLAALIDVGNGGIADRYQDIALAVRSIKNEWQDEKLVALFYSSYGLKEIDEQKLAFYT